MARSLIVLVTTCLLTLSAFGAPPISWQTYDNQTYGYAVELPLGMFTGSRLGDEGVTLLDSDGPGRIDVYGAVNTRNLSPREFAEALASADRIREITYARRGSSWFVISGYQYPEDEEGEELIFYAKFMFSPDRRSFSAFEASYPVSDKRRYDPIIERMEDSLTSPALD